MHTCERSKKKKTTTFGSQHRQRSDYSQVQVVYTIWAVSKKNKQKKKQDVNKCVIKEFTIMFQYGYAANDQISMGCKRATKQTKKRNTKKQTNQQTNSLICVTGLCGTQPCKCANASSGFFHGQ